MDKDIKPRFLALLSSCGYQYDDSQCRKRGSYPHMVDVVVLPAIIGDGKKVLIVDGSLTYIYMPYIYLFFLRLSLPIIPIHLPNI